MAAQAFDARALLDAPPDHAPAPVADPVARLGDEQRRAVRLGPRAQVAAASRTWWRARASNYGDQPPRSRVGARFTGTAGAKLACLRVGPLDLQSVRPARGRDRIRAPHREHRLPRGCRTLVRGVGPRPAAAKRSTSPATARSKRGGSSHSRDERLVAAVADQYANQLLRRERALTYIAEREFPRPPLEPYWVDYASGAELYDGAASCWRQRIPGRYWTNILYCG